MLDTPSHQPPRGEVGERHALPVDRKLARDHRRQCRCVRDPRAASGWCAVRHAVSYSDCVDFDGARADAEQDAIDRTMDRIYADEQRLADVIDSAVTAAPPTLNSCDHENPVRTLSDALIVLATANRPLCENYCGPNSAAAMRELRILSDDANRYVNDAVRAAAEREVRGEA